MIRQPRRCGYFIGDACVVKVKEIMYNNRLYTIPIPDGMAGETTKMLTQKIFDIQVCCIVTPPLRNQLVPFATTYI